MPGATKQTRLHKKECQKFVENIALNKWQNFDSKNFEMNSIREIQLNTNSLKSIECSCGYFL